MKIRTAVLFLLFIATVTFFMLATKFGDGYSRISPVVPGIKTDPRPAIPVYLGEKITYDVNLGRLHVGQSFFNFISRVQVNGKMLNCIVFETRVPQFSDTEKIYSDPRTFLPVKIERNISKLFLKENITEDYDQINHSVTIKKQTTLRRENEPEIIKSDREIYNPILIPHYIRSMPNLHVGQTFDINLPKYRIALTLVSIESIEVPAGTFEAYHFQSDPKQIEFWIKTDQSRVPIKIVGTGAYGYNMVMTEYSRK